MKRTRGSGFSSGKRLRTAISSRTSRILAARRARMRIPRFLVGRVATTGFFGRFQPQGPEMKFLDTTVAASSPATTGTIFSSSLNIIPQDDTQSGRIGRKVTVKRVQLRGQVLLPATTTAADTADRLRILVVLDMQANGASPLVGQVMETGSINSYLDMANVSRFRVLADKLFTLSASAAGAPTGTPSFGAVLKSFSIYKKVNIPIEYDASASTGALTTIRSNNILVVALTQNALATLAFTSRIRYTDM